LGAKVRWWVGRYGLAEVSGVGCAFLSSASTHALTGSEFAAAYAAALGETAGFYGVMLARDLWCDRRARRAQGRSYGFRGVRDTARNLLIEFGPAELADVAVVRPTAIRICTALLDREFGVAAGKVIADVVFYSTAIAAYGLRRRLAGKRRRVTSTE
jgi:hypothetical protein